MTTIKLPSSQILQTQIDECLFADNTSEAMAVILCAPRSKRCCSVRAVRVSTRRKISEFRNSKGEWTVDCFTHCSKPFVLTSLKSDQKAMVNESDIVLASNDLLFPDDVEVEGFLLDADTRDKLLDDWKSDVALNAVPGPVTIVDPPNVPITHYCQLWDRDPTASVTKWIGPPETSLLIR